MADGMGIRVQADRALTEWTENAERNFRSLILGTVYAIGASAATRAQANAPIDTGDLRRSLQNSIMTTPPRETGSGASLAVEIDVKATEPYALKMHEQLLPYGAGPFQRGPLSRRQPSTREGGVGGKYLTRAIEKNIDRFQNFLAGTVEQNLGRLAKKVTVTARPQ